MSAHWGKLACDILTGKWDVALEELNTLREAIDSRTSSLPPSFSSPSTANLAADPALMQLHARTWLLHWSLFVYFNHTQGRTLLLETFLTPNYLNTIQTSCPWILRYLTTAAILSRKSSSGLLSSRVRHALREIVKVIQMEEYQYQDPITSFLKQLYVEFDFEAAQKELGKAEQVVGNDFFLGEFRDDFLDNARYLISEAYCRIHQRIDIGCVFNFGISRLHCRPHHAFMYVMQGSLRSIEPFPRWRREMDSQPHPWNQDGRRCENWPWKGSCLSFALLISPFYQSLTVFICGIECHRNKSTTTAHLSNCYRENSGTCYQDSNCWSGYYAVTTTDWFEWAEWGSASCCRGRSLSERGRRLRDVSYHSCVFFWCGIFDAFLYTLPARWEFSGYK